MTVNQLIEFLKNWQAEGKGDYTVVIGDTYEPGTYSIDECVEDGETIILK